MIREIAANCPIRARRDAGALPSGPAQRKRATFAQGGPFQMFRCDRDQIGSATVVPSLNGPVATPGGAMPEQTGLPYLSRRCDR